MCDIFYGLAVKTGSVDLQKFFNFFIYYNFYLFLSNTLTLFSCYCAEFVVSLNAESGGPLNQNSSVDEIYAYIQRGLRSIAAEAAVETANH